MSAGDPAAALISLARELRAEGSVLSPHVVGEPAARPALGELTAAGPRAAADPAAYACLIESIREGYLLHYGTPRLVGAADGDLKLLAGDYLYARGLERLAALGDLEAIRELSDLIALSAQLHSDGPAAATAEALWLASAVAVGCGAGEAHESAKTLARAGEPAAAGALARSARERAARSGIDEKLSVAAETVGFPLSQSA